MCVEYIDALNPFPCFSCQFKEFRCPKESCCARVIVLRVNVDKLYGLDIFLGKHD